MKKTKFTLFFYSDTVNSTLKMVLIPREAEFYPCWGSSVPGAGNHNTACPLCPEINDNSHFITYKPTYHILEMG